MGETELSYDVFLKFSFWPFEVNEVKLKFMFSKKATKIDEIFTVCFTVCSKCQIDSEDFVKFCSLLGKHELYKKC